LTTHNSFNGVDGVLKNLRVNFTDQHVTLEFIKFLFNLFTNIFSV